MARSNRLRLTFANASVITAAGLLVVGWGVYLWLDIATHSAFYPLPATALFAAFFALPALALLWRTPLRVKLALVGAFLLLTLVVRNIEWNSRKSFISALGGLQAGMTEAQADAQMHGFLRAPHTGISAYGTVTYRHTNEGWGDSDLGLVTFTDGRVEKIEYLPD